MTVNFLPYIQFGASLSQGQKTIREHVLEIDLTSQERYRLAHLAGGIGRGGDWRHVQIRATNTPDRKTDAFTIWDATGVYGIHAGNAERRDFLRGLINDLELDETVKTETLEALDYYA